MKTQIGGYDTSALGSISHHQAALKWVLQNPDIATTIPGMKSLAELTENMAVMGMQLKARDQRILQTYSKGLQPYYCHMCGACEGSCPQGVEISSVNRSLMYAEGYRNRDLALSTYQEIPPTSRALVCTDCTECIAHCSNGLNISVKMERARELFG